MVRYNMGMKKTIMRGSAVFTLQAGDKVTVHHMDQPEPHLVEATVTEVHQGQHRMCQRNYDFFAFSVEFKGMTWTTMLDPRTIVLKHTEKR